MFARVVVDIKAKELNESFEYHIPEQLEPFVFIGSRVRVSFGMQEVLGYVIEILETSDFKGNFKDILEIYSFEKEITEEQLQLAYHLVEDLNISLVHGLSMMLPTFLKEKRKKFLYIDNYDNLNPELVEKFKGKEKIAINDDLENLQKLIKQEIDKGNAHIGYDFSNYGVRKKALVYSLISQDMTKSKMRNEVINYLQEKKEAFEDDILLATGVSKTLLRSMIKEKIIKYQLKYRIDNIHIPFKNKSLYEMSFDQGQLLLKYQESGYKPYLLYTNNEVFVLNFLLKIIEKAIIKQQKVIIFAPTIMVIEKVKLFLDRNLDGVRIDTFHSQNTQSENYESYMDVKHNNYDCFLTTPMGAFLPFVDVSEIIVLDEENNSYISENYPYYDVRRLLETRSKNLGCKIIFESMAPSINSFYKQRMNQYYLLEDITDFKHQVSIVDMKEEALEENDLVISSYLQKRIRETIASGKITMLIVNNKSFSTLIKCRECGKILKCPKCNIPLVFVQSKKMAKCNYCGYHTEDYNHCSCGSENFISLGFGLEKVKYKISMMFPTARIMQVDSDNINNLEKRFDLFNDIEDGNVDIILGTNMLLDTIKGNISLVGLLYIDGYLNIDDYRGSEYTYNLIAKMRRFDEVVVQTYNKRHYAIVNAAIGNYDAYYEEEINNREILQYEPFSEMNEIIIVGPYDKMFHFAYYYRKVMNRVIGNGFLGPIYDYRYGGVKIILKHNHHHEVVTILNETIKNFKDSNLQVTYIRYPKRM